MNDNTEVKEPEVAAEVSPEAVEKTAQEVVNDKLIQGEIHIATMPDGSMQVAYPQNIVAALGLIEIAKEMMLEAYRESNKKANAAARQRPPAIIPAGADAIKNLRRMS